MARYRPGGGETICPPPMAVRRWQKSRRWLSCRHGTDRRTDRAIPKCPLGRGIKYVREIFIHPVVAETVKLNLNLLLSSLHTGTLKQNNSNSKSETLWFRLYVRFIASSTFNCLTFEFFKVRKQRCVSSFSPPSFC